MSTMVDMPTWALTRDRIWHISESNVCPGYWDHGVTFCHRREDLSRTDRQPSPRHHHVCRDCITAALEMGERLPAWMARRAR